MLKNSDQKPTAANNKLASENRGKAQNAEPMAGDELARIIREGFDKKLNSYRVTGDVNLAGVTVNKPLVIRGVTFEGTVNFSQARFKLGVDLSRCCFNQKLIFSDASVEGPLNLDETVIGNRLGPLPDLQGLRQISARLQQRWERVRPRAGDSVEESSRKREIRRGRDKNLRALRRRIKEAETLYAEMKTPAEFDGLRVAGYLSMMKSTVFGGLAGNHAQVESDFRLDGARIYEGLSLRHSRLGELRTDARNLLAGGTLWPNQEKQCRIHGNLDLTSAVITGDLRLTGITIGGELRMQSAEVKGNLLCRASEGLDTRIRGQAWLASLRVKGAADFSGTRFYDEMSVQGGNIGGNFFFRARPIEKPGGTVKYIRGKIVGKVWLLGITVSGDIDISGTQIGGNLQLQNASIGQNLMAKTMGGFQTKLAQGIDLNGARIRGGIQIAGATLHDRLEMDGASVDGGLSAGFDLSDIGGWRIVRSVLRRGLSAESATIGKTVLLAGVDVGPADGSSEAALSFVGAQVNGEFSLYSKEHGLKILKTLLSGFQATTISAEEKQRILEQASRQLTIISGDLRLNRAQLFGGLTLDGATIGGDLDLRDVNARAFINCHTLELAPGEVQRAWARRADLETLEMTGDVNLTGLTLGEQNGATGGDLILRDTRIRGRLELFPFDFKENLMDAPECRDRITLIRGDLRLDAAQVYHLILSGRTFELEPAPQAGSQAVGRFKRVWRRVAAAGKFLFQGGPPEESRGARVGLERATIGRLQIVQPLPGTLDLSNLKVDRWSLPEDPSSYRMMLANSYPFKKSNYLAIENALRNAGEEEKADDVHVWMRRRDRRTIKNFGRRLFDLFLDLSIGYGTTSKRIVYAMLLLFALSFVIFMEPSHVEYNIAPTAQAAPPVRHPDDWGPGDAVLFAVRLHVPIIPLAVEEDVQPSDMRLKAYAVAVVVANWVMWPLLIASASGFIRRRQ